MRYLPYLFALIFIGCGSSGMSREAFRLQIADQAPVFDDKAIRDALAAKPQLPKPFRVAVLFDDYGGSPWRVKQREEVFALGEELKKTGEVSAFYPLHSDQVAHGERFGRDVRFAAAQTGADAVLVVRLYDHVQNRLNGWAWTYPLLAPVFFAPGNTIGGETIARAYLSDVRNGYLYMTAEAEEEVRTYRPAAFSGQTRIVEKLMDKTVSALRREISRQLGHMVASR